MAGEHFFQRFWSNLKERHVTRIAIAYLGVGWGVLETLEFTLGLLQAPDWMFRAGVALVGLGFPVALVLSWIFDIRGGQVVRTDGKTSRWPKWVKAAVSAPLLVLVVVSSYWVWTGYVEEKERSLRPTDLGDEVPIVAVLPIRNLTGDPELDWFGEGIVNLVRDNLSRSRFLRIASPQKLKVIVGDATDELEIAELAAEQDIGFIMAGEMLMTPAGIYVSSRLTDTAGGVVLSAKQVENLEPATILEAAGPIAAQIRRGLGVPREEQVDVFVADFAIDNQEAYEHYVSGLDHLLYFRYNEAKGEFEAALALAPDFGIARYRLAYIQAADSEVDTAVANMELALQDPFLLERERLYLEGSLSFFDQQYDEAIGQFEALLQRYPYEIEAREYLAMAHWGNYQLAPAIELLREVTVEEPRNAVIWGRLGSYLLEDGDLEQAQQALDRFATLAPDNPNSHTLLGDAMRMRGDYTGAEQQYQRALELSPDMPEVKYGLALLDWLKGDAPAALEAFEAIASDPGQAANEQLDALFAMVALLTARGDCPGTLAWIDRLQPELHAERVRWSLALSAKANCQASMGEEEAALQTLAEAIEQSPSVPTRYLFARATLELHMGSLAAARATAEEIRSYALPPDDPDRTEDQAAAYIDSQADWLQGRVEEAEKGMKLALEMEGYRYALYPVALATMLIERGAYEEALEWLDEQLRPLPLDPRIDLEPHRMEALIRSADALIMLGRDAEARARAEQFLQRRDRAVDTDPDVVRAREILAGGRTQASAEG